MSSIFSYESKMMQTLMFLGDLMILNFLYLVCCIPIFTIGAAQAGLHTAVKVLLDKEDDTSPSAAFFRGFISGFGTITLAWALASVLLAVLVYLGLTAIAMGSPIWLAVLPMILAAIFHALIPAFHSRFGCTALQLFRNAFFLLFAHPLRSIATAAVIWLPVVVFMLDLYLFMTITPIWATLYFSTAFCFGATFLKKPFKTLLDHFNETHGNAEASAAELPEAEAEEEGYGQENTEEYEEEYEEEGTEPDQEELPV